MLKSIIVLKKALEIHKPAKHQIELVLSHFRNVYHAEDLAMIKFKENTIKSYQMDIIDSRIW